MPDRLRRNGGWASATSRPFRMRKKRLREPFTRPCCCLYEQHHGPRAALEVVGSFSGSKGWSQRQVDVHKRLSSTRIAALGMTPGLALAGDLHTKRLPKARLLRSPHCTRTAKTLRSHPSRVNVLVIKTLNP
jgi:hypothetical protein